MGAAVIRRVVLDTNVILSALLFNHGRLAWIRHAWQRHELQPVVCKETVSEFLRVLAYPKLKLSPADREELLADFLPYTDVVVLPATWPAPPICRDHKDQVFLALAVVSSADALVTGDADLLAVQDHFPGAILTADALAATRG